MSIPKKIDPAAQYEVALLRAVTVGKRVLVPRLPHTVKGSILETIKEDVSDARLVKTAN